MSQQPPNQGPGQSPRTGGTVVSEGAPAGAAPQQHYASAGVPGVAVSLPGRSDQNPYAAPPVQQHAHPQHAPQQHHPVQQQPQVQAQQHQPPPGAAPQGMPSAPPGARGRNDDQLATGGKHTVYEFTGEHSDEQRSGGRHQTFFGDAAELSMADASSPERDTNLRGGSAGWIIGAVVVVLAGGIFGALTIFGAGADAADAEDELPGVSAADQAAPAEATPAVVAAADTGGEQAATTGAEDDEAAAKAEAEAKAKAEQEAAAKAKAEQEAAAKAEAEAKAAEEKKKAAAPTKKKKSSTTKKKTAPAPSKPSSDSKKPISITPSGGVREPKKFGGLPEP